MASGGLRPRPACVGGGGGEHGSPPIPLRFVAPWGPSSLTMATHTRLLSEELFFTGQNWAEQKKWPSVCVPLTFLNNFFSNKIENKGLVQKSPFDSGSSATHGPRTSFLSQAHGQGSSSCAPLHGPRYRKARSPPEPG